MNFRYALFAVLRPICRFISALLWQLLWLVPLWGVCAYAKWRLPHAIKSHFGVDQLQDRLTSLDHFAEFMKASSSMTNPTAMLKYLSAQITKLTVSTRLHTAQVTSDIVQSVCLWGLSAIMAVALVYAVFRAFKLYKAKSEIYETAITVERALLPEFQVLHDEIQLLRAEINELKQQALPAKEHNVPRLPKK